jgi:hypothetical protein
MSELKCVDKELLHDSLLATKVSPFVSDARGNIGPILLYGELSTYVYILHTLIAFQTLCAGKLDFIFINPQSNIGKEGWCCDFNLSWPSR